MNKAQTIAKGVGMAVCVVVLLAVAVLVVSLMVAGIVGLWRVILGGA